MSTAIENEVIYKAKLAKEASLEMQNKTTEEKNTTLLAIAEQLLIDQAFILKENAKDIEYAHKLGLSESIIDRLMLNPERVKAMSDAIHLVINLPDPIGEELERINKDNGLIISKRRVPLGVLGMIYEARPNVTIDAATLSLKTGNTVLLRGSSSAKHSNMALVTSIHQALKRVQFPQNAVLLIEDTSRETAKTLFNLTEYLDLLIPRGGKDLIDLVVREASVPVIETGAGNCHVFVDATAKYDIVRPIVLNAKTQRPSVCNAIESLLIHDEFFNNYGKELLETVSIAGVKIYGDEKVCKSFPTALKATEEHYAKEFSDLIISVKTVNSVEEAIAHINQYGTKHSECIVSETPKNVEQFLNVIDAAVVYHNASTRFTDGFEFGYGAEIGISTQKLHVRGPMGLPALTTTKYYVNGDGQIRL
ncbi:glutamate-5-semialdehyde dehydrogenase [Priestia megaterium]|uniref:glutamate-5-semialdehyde dehydrogenase n=1 Tax=Priestia megaterium TaxID=1404 RepID=UPI001BEAFD80|nr:glutamate-5-semialdehyde dehydrogenase [Priestia megaterium]MBT2259473.1 glutamate-5-semialdehyde dehydrogenase [Priestia megaterium]MBT2281885.1 glutamate-5-semialdehyde dehydrogenase [Priestia megaterium]